MFEKRIQNLQNLLKEDKLESLLVTSPYNIAYLSGIRAFSIEEREAWILVTQKEIFLFTDARYTEMVKAKAPFINLVETTHENPLTKGLNDILESQNIKQIGFEEEHTTYSEASIYEEKIDCDLIPVSGFVEELREIKDRNEIESIKKACALTDEGFKFILPYLKPDVTETEIKLTLENFIRSRGGALSFESIVAFGKNAAIPHHLSGDTKLLKNDVVLLDFGSKVDGYCSDMTRTVFLGKPPEKISKMYNSNLKAQTEALEYLKTHNEKDFSSKKATEVANEILQENGFPPVPHGLGHGVGLQVHENPRLSPISDDKLKPGAIVTVEPGIYDPKTTGIRIEDTVLITPKGIEILTRSPKNLVIL